MKYIFGFLIFSALSACSTVSTNDSETENNTAIKASKSSVEPAFQLITLGDTGGIKDGNLSAFLLRSLEEERYVALDAGSIVNGIDVALKEGAFDNLKSKPDDNLQANGNVLHNHVAAYLISHAHLDHVAGLLVASPDDNNKPIYALKSVNDTMGATYFNWQAWANFTNRGLEPKLNKYDVIDLAPQHTTAIEGTNLTVTPFSLSHPLESTAFVIESNNDMFVYFGDTGPDDVEKEGKLGVIWRYLAQQMRNKTLRGMVIEVSFDNSRPDKLLFGHLTPKWLLQELTRFYELVEDKSQVPDINIVISHIKYSLKAGENPRSVISKELKQANKLGFNLILATQGQSHIF